MREELLKKINPIIETFVDDTLKSFSNLENIRKQCINKEREYSDLIDEKQKDVNDFKKEKTDNKRVFDEKITELEKEKQNFTLKAKNYDELANEIKVDKAEIAKKLDKINLELIIAKDKSTIAEKNKAEVDKLKNSYELKAKGLYSEDNRLKAKKKEYDETEKKLDIRDAELDKKQIELNNESQKLKDMDLKLRAKQKMVEELIKQHKLKEYLKEN